VNLAFSTFLYHRKEILVVSELIHEFYGAHSRCYWTSLSNACTVLAVFHHMFMSSIRIRKHVSHIKPNLSGTSEMGHSHCPFMILRNFLGFFPCDIRGKKHGGGSEHSKSSKSEFFSWHFHRKTF